MAGGMFANPWQQSVRKSTARDHQAFPANAKSESGMLGVTFADTGGMVGKSLH